MVNDGEGQHAELELKPISFDGEVLTTKKIEIDISEFSSHIYSLATSELLEGADPSNVPQQPVKVMAMISGSDHTLVRPKELSLPDQDLRFSIKRA